MGEQRQSLTTGRGHFEGRIYFLTGTVDDLAIWRGTLTEIQIDEVMRSGAASVNVSDSRSSGRAPHR